MDKEKFMELEKSELVMLKEFLAALHAERDAIISFSLEAIIRENNRKEDILRKLEFLEDEKSRLRGSGEADLPAGGDGEKLSSEFRTTVAAVKNALQKNGQLLSFSMDHVKSSIERIVSFINKASYGHKRESISMLVSRKV